MKDSIVESVIYQFKERSSVGIKKYNTTLDRTDLSTREWQNHMKCELMDGILYLEKLCQQEDLLSEAMIVIDDYLNAGCKETRTDAAEKAKALYEKYHGTKYKNRNERV